MSYSADNLLTVKTAVSFLWNTEYIVLRLYEWLISTISIFFNVITL